MRPLDVLTGIKCGVSAAKVTPPVGSRPVQAAPAQEVRRRHVLYVSGYLPQEPAQHRRLLGLELRRFGKLWGVQMTAPRDPLPDPPDVAWPLTLRAGDVRVDVVYEYLRWDDIVARDFAAPLALKILLGLGTVWDAVTSGLLWKVARAAPWCAVAWAYPATIALAAGVLAALKGGLAFWAAVTLGLEEIGAALALGVFAIGWVGIMHLIRRSGGYVVHLMDDGRSQSRYARRDDPELEARIDVFASRIRAVMREDAADEVLVVGHSSGAFLAIDAVARAYEADPALARNGPKLSLLTVGAMELLVALHPAAGWLRDRIARLAAEPTLFWAEVVGPWDALNFPRRDPVAELGLKVPADRPNPTFRRAYLSKMLTEKTITAIRSKLSVFRLHHQFVMANEVRGPYDHFALICGPWTARSQFERTRNGHLMAPLPGDPPKPLPRPAYLAPLDNGAALRRRFFRSAVRPSDGWTPADPLP